MRVDPERVTIQAYPGRVFMHGGWRYKIHDWNADDLARRSWLACDVDDVHSRTWRIRTPTVSRMRADGDPVVIRSHQGLLLKRVSIALEYEEEVSGVLRLEWDVSSGTRRLQESRLVRPLAAPAFPTSGVALIFQADSGVPGPDVATLSSLCAALGYVLPVHVGVEEDAIEVVALSSRHIDTTRIDGVAIVDLYPTGIGLVEAFRQDDNLIVHLLECTRSWLAATVRRSAAQAADLRHAPLGRASRNELDATAALDLLVRVLGP